MNKTKLKKLFTRQSILTVFLMLFIGFMCISTLNRITVIKRESLKATYASQLKKENSKPMAMAKTVRSTLLNLDDYIIGKKEFINLYGLTQRLTLNRYVRDVEKTIDDVVKLDNGAITFYGYEQKDLTDVAVNNLTTLKSALDKKGIDLMYIIAPSKVDPKNTELPRGVEDRQNPKAQALKEALAEAGIDTRSLIDEIDLQGLDHSSMFFRTDHHWTPSAALWAAQTVCGWLNRDYGYNIDLSLLDKDKFESKVYKDIFLGSQGKKVGTKYAGVDDFELLTPKYDTDFTFWRLRVNNEATSLNGSFEKSLIFKRHLRYDYFNENVYATYSDSDYKKSCITNHRLNTGRKILLVRDSYSCTFAPFFSLAACDRLFTVDPRYYEGSMLELVDAVEPDMVMYLEFTNFNVVKKPIK